MQLRGTILRSRLLFPIVTALALICAPQISAREPEAQTLTGVVSDAICGATHSMKNMTPGQCTRECAKVGGYALVVGKDVYKLKGHEAELEKLAAETVTVKGLVTGKTVTVESVALK
jgi:hypothetical protein